MSINFLISQAKLIQEVIDAIMMQALLITNTQRIPK